MTKVKKIPHKISDELHNKARPIIDKIAKARSRTCAFAYYAPEDIYQEVWIMCLDALGRWDQDRPMADCPDQQIENFLNKHVANRMKNLYRDKYFRPDGNEEIDGTSKDRINLVNALPLDLADAASAFKTICFSSSYGHPSDDMVSEEMFKHVLKNIDEDLAGHFIDMCEKNKVHKTIRRKVMIAVSGILYNNETNQ